MQNTSSAIYEFRERLWAYYAEHGRDLPWREPEVDGSFDPYKILVSEIMLQQTQVIRVIPKYHAFLETFPSVTALAQASLAQVLRMWSGLGYNRRAKFLHQAAQIVQSHYGGMLPKTLGELMSLPGVGHNTAGAIMAYAYNQPVAFVETNIRTVLIFHFFPSPTLITDKELLPLLKELLETEEPRDFYWALMDYGSFLKSSVGNLSQQSKNYKKQSRFEGSKRQLRGKVIKILTGGPQNMHELQQLVSDERLQGVLHELEGENLICLSRGRYRLD